MRFGFVVPMGSVQEQVQRAVLAEQAGWDGVFVWEGAYHLDAWCLLSAIATQTSRIRIGTLLTPLPWREPWTLAAQAATVDQLSGGRVILTVGLGARETGRAVRAHPKDRVTRAELLDEGLDVMRKLWRGERRHEGTHYQLRLDPEPQRTLAPVQPGGVPVWVVGAWRRMKSMRRALACDGVVPFVMGREPTPDDLHAIVAWLASNEHPEPYDVVWEGETPIDDPGRASEMVAPWAEAGATWWIESRWMQPDEAEARIAAGPPR